MSSIRIFADLKEKYPTWPDLKAFLTGDAGGRLEVIGEGSTVIIRYDKKTSDFTVPYVHVFRSVVWDTVANLPKSVAPFKACDGVPESKDSLLIQDFVEGVMIQAYMTYADTHVHLATRSKLGANTRFYSKRNFSDLLTDVPGLQLDKILPPPTTPEAIPYTFASLVLQHPEHRIVAPALNPRIYVVSIGYVSADGTVLINENPETWPPAAAALAPQTKGLHPLTLGWSWQGLVYKNPTTLQRWRERNPAHTLVRDLRGNEADSYSRFLRLRKGGQLPDYISYYPEEKDLFYQIEVKLQEQTKELFADYNAVHRGPREARKHLKEVGWPLNKHIFTLHGLYMKELKPAKQELTIELVTQYVNALDVLKQRALLVTPIGGKVHPGQRQSEEVDISLE